MLLLLLSNIILCGYPAAAPAAPQTTAQLFVRYERAASGHAISEDLLRLKNTLVSADKVTVAIRLCTTKPLPVAAADAINPFNLAELFWSYGYAPGRVRFTRYDKCSLPSDDPHTPATEVWIVPEGAAPPPSSEELESASVRMSSLGRRPFNRGVCDYKAALNRLVVNLKKDPDNVGVVFGYFLKRPSPALRRRVREAAEFLRRSGLPRERYLVRLRYWNDEVSIYPPDSEPQYPDVLLVEVTGGRAAASPKGKAARR
jgi:hypothetical protein